MKEIEELQKKIGITFSDENLLKTALTHSSFVNENKNVNDVPSDNERLEFFGDAIIEFYVSDYLFKKYKDIPEGDLTKLRASMVCEQSLAKCAALIELGEYLRMGKGEENSGGRERASITSDAFEALTAAIYLDAGSKYVVSFLDEYLMKTLENKDLFFDAKTRLQEIVQKDGSRDLSYQMLSEEGPGHRKVFVEAAILDGREIGRGKGYSKKAAQQKAALMAIRTLVGEEGQEPSAGEVE